MSRALDLSHAEPCPAGAWLGTGRRSSFALFSLVAALYLVVALSVPGTFLIAKQASLFFSVQHSSLSERLGSNADEEDKDDSWTGPKRLRAALLSKVGVSKAGIAKKHFVSSLLVFPLPRLQQIVPEHAQSKLLVAQEVPPSKDKAFPQEHLGRGPPLAPPIGGTSPPRLQWAR
jgi:hypothetical protein